jgi:hypothetical protein
MKRRDLIALIGGAAVCWPQAARAQQQVAKPRAVGFIGPSTASADVRRRAAFAKRLGELGWVDGRSAPDVRNVFVSPMQVANWRRRRQNCQNSLLAGTMHHCRVQRTNRL